MSALRTRRLRHSARCAAGAVAALSIACASPGIPPGGPEDIEPPALLALTPDTQSVGVKGAMVVFRFDEVVNERSMPGASNTAAASSRRSGTGNASGASGGSRAGDRSAGTGDLSGMSGAGAMVGMSGTFGGSGSPMAGGSSLAAMFAISPSDGRERIRWKREVIEIEPRGGFRPNTTYSIVLLPGLSDLRGNARKEGTALAFSTGSTLARGVLDGIIFDWVGGKAAAGARIEAYAPSDTAFRWRTRADATGRFRIPLLAEGRYLLRGWLDQNQSGTIDGREAFDTLTVVLSDSASRSLYAFEHDTIGPRLERVELVDSTAIRLQFDRATAPDWTPLPTTLTLQRADSSRIPIRLPIPLAVFDSLRAAGRSASDSTAADTSATDATAKRTRPADAATQRAPAPPTRRGGEPASRAGVPEPIAETAPTEPMPALDRPIPIVTWVVPLDTALTPGLYRLKVRQVRGLTGRVKDSERDLRVRPPAPKDSTAGRRDSTATRRDATAGRRDSTPPPTRRP
jgi:hypothetical protein